MSAGDDAPQAHPIAAPAVYQFLRPAEGLLPWSHAVERLQKARNYWLATVRPDGRPHVTPIWGVWLDESLYFDGFPMARWARNLAANPAISIHLEDGCDVVILEGQVEDLTTDEATAERIVATWNEKYGALAPQPATSGLLRLRPTNARAWLESDAPANGTRWTFPDRRQ